MAVGAAAAVGEVAAEAVAALPRAIDAARAIAGIVSALRMEFLLNGPGFVPGTPDMRDILGAWLRAARAAGEGAAEGPSP
ncbi:hypothetical protein GCM10010215_14070 [Streptomyces virginiae]|uniref:TetR family transcriptional regulator n=1 Tax=Streptomyces virginiae TaxID=1961 RepID=A0ABQ3NVM0_STRVG|nr:hypothetical protein GCM10010215_14070 [Streptomyces virginiae]GHI16830.1 hypothetical protein Scinn_62930 [Streptomyces virginiae]GLV90233.1 hypothetical protein Slala04_16870 [Streptomyces lavendulae subsp. lavendulae]